VIVLKLKHKAGLRCISAEEYSKIALEMSTFKKDVTVKMPIIILKIIILE
jgi:hypothetical protein